MNLKQRENMKIEITDVDKSEMVHFLLRIFGEMTIPDDEISRINSELSDYGYELSWYEACDCWEIYSR